MFQMIVLYDKPADAAAFDAHYDTVHTPLAERIPGVRRLTVARPGPADDGTAAAWHLVATLEFDDQAAFEAGMGSPEGQAAVADLPRFAGAGVTVLAAPDVRQIL
ncbi:EthD family reductase [Nakamurella sp.]|uniref:EthD family reductase n=1 Tax=Nakamurella sp. TaxID=1869182 RepID=UPI003B3AABCE